MKPQTTDYCHISGFTGEIDRAFLRKELSKFGEIRKIFVPTSGVFAKVYFTDSQAARQTVQGLKQNLFGWIVSFQQETRYTSSESSSISKMNCDDEIDVQCAQKLYTVHGECIESLEDDMGNNFVNLEDVRRAGFAVYSEEDLNFSIEQKRKIVLDDFHQYMLSQAVAYLYKNKELHKFIKEDQILNTIERCRMKLLGDSHDNSNDRIVTQSNSNLQISVSNQQSPRETNRQSPREANRQSPQETNRKIPRDKSLGRHREKEYSSGRNNSFTEEPHAVSTPKFLPNNVTPTRTQSSTSVGTPYRNRDSSFNRNKNGTYDNNQRRLGQNRNSRQISRNNDEKCREYERTKSKQRNNKPTTSNNFEELRETERPELKQQSQQFSKDSQFGNNRQQNAANNSNINRRTEFNQCDTKPQTSDTIGIEKFEKVNLEINQTYDVQITEVEKDNICWAIETKSLSDLGELCLEDCSELKIIENVQRGQLGLAEFENVWCRCQVISVKPTNVLFVDYGNKADVNEIRELPDKLRKIPGLAIRLAVSNNSSPPKTGTSLKIKVKRKYDRGTYLVDFDLASLKEDNSNESAPKHLPKSDIVSAEPIKEFNTETKERCYFDLPKPLVELKNNDKVMLLDIVGNKFAVKTRECAQKSKELLEYIKTIDISSLILQQVEEGQLVLSSKDGLPNLCRAVVTKKQSPAVATVEYLDYAGRENLSIKSLRNVDEYLASQPITLILTPELEVINTITKPSIDFIVSLIENKQKADVVFTDNVFDLKLEDGSLFTQKLLELEKSKLDICPKLVAVDNLTNSPKIKEPEKPTASEPAKPIASVPAKSIASEPAKSIATEPAKSIASEPAKPIASEPAIMPQKSAVLDTKPESDDNVITLADMDYIKPKIGSTDSYICYTLKDLSELILISLDEDSVANLENIYNLDISDDQPYKPEVSEMCVFLYKSPEESEPAWYRGVVLDNEGDEYTISMVDFGIMASTTSKDIRKFPAHLKAIPMLGIFCKLINIPHTPEILNAIQNIVKEGENVDVTIKGEDDLTYDIELPKVYEELKKLNLF